MAEWRRATRRDRNTKVPGTPRRIIYHMAISSLNFKIFSTKTKENHPKRRHECILLVSMSPMRDALLREMLPRVLRYGGLLLWPLCGQQHLPYSS